MGEIEKGMILIGEMSMGTILLGEMFVGVIELRDAEFFKNRFNKTPLYNDKIVKLDRSIKNNGKSTKPFEPRSGKRIKTKWSFKQDYVVYLVECTRESSCNQIMITHTIEINLLTYDKATKSQDVAIWKEVINNDMDSTISNNTWKLVDLPIVQHLLVANGF